jgi:hypothetical protein
VYRNGEMIVKRNLFFDGNITKEVNVKWKLNLLLFLLY